MLAEQVDYVVGVDTHRDQHALAIVDAHTGAVIAQTTTAASARGYAHAVRFADQHAPGDRRWAIEGTGHYGAGLVRHLQRQGGEQVHEDDRTSRSERRLRGKDDQLDADRCRSLSPRSASIGQDREPASIRRRCGSCCWPGEPRSIPGELRSRNCAA